LLRPQEGENTTLIIKVNPINPEKDRIAKAAKIIREGGLVAFPTETVYGLGADALNPEAVKKVYEVKRRPRNIPLILHISSIDQLVEYAFDPPESVLKLAKKLWPGPITFVLKKSKKVPGIVTGGRNSVGIRMPAHPVALSLIEESNRPLVGPSANLHGRPSPISAEHVKEDLYGRIDAILDGGDVTFGIESTVIDFTSTPPTLMRPGPLTIEEIEGLIGGRILVTEKARGLVIDRAQYSPRTPLVVVEGSIGRVMDRISRMASEMSSLGLKIAIISPTESLKRYEGLNAKVIDIGPKESPIEIARNLFKILREIDKIGVDLALVEGIEEKGLGLAIMSRLRKASGRPPIRV